MADIETVELHSSTNTGTDPGMLVLLSTLSLSSARLKEKEMIPLIAGYRVLWFVGVFVFFFLKVRVIAYFDFFLVVMKESPSLQRWSFT